MSIQRPDVVKRLSRYEGLSVNTGRPPTDPCITTSEAIQTANYIGELERRLGLLPERRLQLEVRAQVDYLIGAGYQIVSREPLRLERGRWVAELRHAGLYQWREHRWGEHE